MRTNEEIKTIKDNIAKGVIYYERHNATKANGCVECSAKCGKPHDMHCGIHYWHEFDPNKEIHREEYWEYITEEELEKIMEKREQKIQLDKKINELSWKVYDEWEKNEENAATLSYIEFSNSTVKSCKKIIDDGIRIFITQNKLEEALNGNDQTIAKELLTKVLEVCSSPNYDIPSSLYADIDKYLKGENDEVRSSSK